MKTSKLTGNSGTVDTIDAYISQFPTDVQTILKRLRSIVQDVVPDSKEAIKYQMPTFVLSENLVHFAAYEKHIGFYPTPSAIEHFEGQLSKYKFAKGSIQFPLELPIPYSLVKKIVQFRASEVRRKLEKSGKPIHGKNTSRTLLKASQDEANGVKKQLPAKRKTTRPIDAKPSAKKATPSTARVKKASKKKG